MPLLLCAAAEGPPPFLLRPARAALASLRAEAAEKDVPGWAALNLSHLGAFLSGAAAVISAIVSLHLARKRAEAECVKRIEEVKKAIHEGYEMRGL